MRLLVTGSRDWDDVETIRRDFELLHALNRTPTGSDIVLVHGACPTGADAIADAIGGMLGWTIEPHPADWATHGKAAGPIRNTHMAELGADLCIAYIRNGSRGATHCAGQASSRHITTVLRHTLS